MERMRKFTLLDAAAGGFRGVPATGWGGEDGRRQRLIGIHDPSGERRLLFGVGEGPTEAVAEAKQEADNGYPPFTLLALMRAKIAALICPASWGQAVTTSARSDVSELGLAAPEI